MLVKRGTSTGTARGVTTSRSAEPSSKDTTRSSSGRKSTSSATIEFHDLSKLTRAVSLVLYGRSGTGKTTFAASAPKSLLYLDIKDEGSDSIADVRGIKGRVIASLDDLDETYWWLRANPQQFKTVVLDTVTQLQGLLVAEVAEKNKRKGAPGDWGTMTKRDWGDVSAIMKERLTNWRDLTALGINVIFIAQDRTFNLSEEEEANPSMLAPEVGPALSPSVAKTLNAAVNVIANTFIREREERTEVKGKKVSKKIIEYCIGLGPSSLYTRKVRKPKSVELPDVIVDPEFDDLLDIIRGE